MNDIIKKLNLKELEKLEKLEKEKILYDLFKNINLNIKWYSYNDKYYTIDNYNCVRIYNKRNKLLHNENGPALIYSYYSSYFCLNGIFYERGNYYHTLNLWAKRTNHIICNICDDFCKQKCFMEEI